MSGTSAHPRWLHVFTEVLLALVALHLFYLSLFRAYPPLLDALGRSFLPGALVALGLLTLRVVTARGGDEPSRFTLGQRLMPGRWLEGVRAPHLVLVVCFLFVFVMLQERGGRVGNDGTMFYIYVRSLVMDGDLDLTNEFETFVPEKFQSVADQARRQGTTPDPGNEIGPAFFWLPFFVAAHLLVKLGNVLGAAIPADGYSYPYINAVCLGTAIWVFLGVVLSYRIARREFAPSVAAWAAAVLWLASPLFWYTVYEPSMSHGVSLAAVALFLTAWLHARDRGGLRAWALVALTAGVMLSVQRYNLFYLAAPALTLLGRLREFLSIRDPKELWRAARIAGWSVLVLALATTPLWVYNLLTHGRLLREGDRPSSAIMFWKSPFFSELLFSSNHGLFSWTPAAYLAVIGLVILVFRKNRVATVLLATLLCGFYLLSSTWDWYAGYSFGSRRLTEAYPIFLFGFCGFLRLALSSPRLLAGALCGALVVWNFLLAGQVRRGEIPPMRTSSFTESSSRGITRFYEAVGYPPAAPANWIFAWVYGVSPERFDWVWGHRAYHNLIIDVGTSFDRYFLGRGWSHPETTPAGIPFRWSDGVSSSWLVYLFAPYPYRLRLQGEPSRSPDGAPQIIGLEVNGKRAGVLTLGRGATSAEAVVAAPFWKAGLNEIVFRYGYTVRADEVYRGSDPRRLGIRLERLELHIDK